jgi:hypothetical protein
MHATTTIAPIECNVQKHVEYLEAFARLWRSPNNDKSGARDEALDEITTFRAKLYVVKRDEIDTRLLLILIFYFEIVFMHIHDASPRSRRRSNPRTQGLA